MTMHQITRINSVGMTYRLTEIDGGTTITCMDLQKTITVEEHIESLDSSWYFWMNGKFIQEAFPNLSPDEREFLMTGITSEEWSELFTDEEEPDGDSN